MKEKVIELVKRVLDLGEEYSDDELMANDLLVLGIDSVTAIQLIIMLESEFDLVFADEDLMLNTVQSVSNIMSVLKKYK